MVVAGIVIEEVVDFPHLPLLALLQRLVGTM
jgi:hypothetical protein